MTRPRPRTLLEAVARRRFPLTGWPWRALAYLLGTPPVAFAAGVPLALLGLPWLYLLGRGTGITELPLGTLALLLALGAVLLGGLGPLVALPLAGLERLRLRLVDNRPVSSGHRPVPAADPWSWLRTRYAEPATWLALLHAGLLGTVGLLLSATAGVLLLLVAVLVAGPVLLHTGDGPISIGFARIDTVAEAVPYSLLGLVLLAVSPYPLAMLAAGQGALTRALLGGAGGQDRLRTELVEVARSRARLVDAFEAERRRIERDLHDGAQQRLVSLTLQLGLARLEIPAGSPGAAAVADAHEQAKLFMTELRELIRNIHPKVLTDRGLPAAVRDLADSSAVPVTVEAELPARLPNPVEGTAYFVVAEALTNVAKHSGATAATVTLRLRGERLTVEVADDGRGGAEPGHGSGLTGLADRVAGVDGRMLLSSPPGGPTLLRVELPC
ncbi:sensor histidine kinase [Micromonospora sp. WMMD1102]|uniref:sensor histidine kinase n=1 Tax=Micromonospora sp. WMMD1102 TaxID=3016105 RepID=UPI002414DF86|nr:sensor histidine kinase [Micromonospora sp. WMMD1102]MDG4789447.1 sensor histidine kinase [Micromonospora sp. WMMD1102]